MKNPKSQERGICTLLIPIHTKKTFIFTGQLQWPLPSPSYTFCMLYVCLWVGVFSTYSVQVSIHNSQYIYRYT